MKDLELEKAILGILVLIDNSILKVNLKSEYFYNEIHREIFECIQTMSDAHIPVDIITLASELRKRKLDVDVFSYLSEITSRVANDSRLEYYSQELIKLWIKRRQLYIGEILVEKAQDETLNCFEINDWVTQQLSAMDFGEANEEHISKTMKSIMRKSEGEEIKHLITGWYNFDKLVQINFRRLVLIAGAEKCGKTKFCFELIRRILESNKLDIGVQWHCLDTSPREMNEIILCNHTGLTPEQLDSIDYELTNEDKRKITECSDIFSKYNWEFRSKENRLVDIQRCFNSFYRKNEHNILVVDTVGNIKKTKPSQTELDDEIVEMFVETRNSTNSLIFLLHHLKKEVDDESRLKDAYRPLLNHIRGSNRFRDYINHVFLLNYPSKYPDLVEQEKITNPDKLFTDGKHMIEELFIADQAVSRRGKTGIARFKGDLGTAKFVEI